MAEPQAGGAAQLQAPAVDGQAGELAIAVERGPHDAVVEPRRLCCHGGVAAGRLGQRRGAERRQVQEQVAIGQVHAAVHGQRVERDGIAAVRQLGRRGLFLAGQDAGELGLQVFVHAGDRAAGKGVVELSEQHAQPRLLAERCAAVGHAQRLAGLQRHLARPVEPLVLGLRGEHAAVRLHVELALVDRQAVAHPRKRGEEGGTGPPRVARGAGQVPEAARALGFPLRSVRRRRRPGRCRSGARRGHRADGGGGAPGGSLPAAPGRCSRWWPGGRRPRCRRPSRATRSCCTGTATPATR